MSARHSKLAVARFCVQLIQESVKQYFTLMNKIDYYNYCFYDFVSNIVLVLYEQPLKEFYIRTVPESKRISH